MELHRRQPTYQALRKVLDHLSQDGQVPSFDALCSNFPCVSRGLLQSLWEMDSDAAECKLYAKTWSGQLSLLNASDTDTSVERASSRSENKEQPVYAGALTAQVQELKLENLHSQLDEITGLVPAFCHGAKSRPP